GEVLWLPKCIAICLMCLLTLCSCNLPLGMNELMNPPRLTADQAALYDALEGAIGTDSFKFKYPRRGDYLSACILRDLDRDGIEEAIAFYELTFNGATSTWMSVLAQQDGVWKSVKEIAGPGGEVDLVSFAPITAQDRDNIVVGWFMPGKDDMGCAIYDYRNRQLGKAYDSEFEYSEMMIHDVDSDGLDELVLCTQSSIRSPVMRLVKFRSGRISRTSEVAMPSGLTGYAQLSFGKLTVGLPAIFADIAMGGDMVTTRLAAIDTSGGTTVLTELSPEDLGIYESFDRQMPTLYCEDVNGDGLEDIPVSHPLPGYENSAAGERVTMIEYRSVVNGSLESVLHTVVNHASGYQVKIPIEWVDRVTVRRQPDTGEWRFVLPANGKADDDTELLRIKVVSPAVYQDKLETVEYHRLATKGVNEYMAYIPSGIYPGLSITYDKLDEFFALL
ncbi:MAG: hypothetical protein RR135_04295, partial [Oscillospiraceae bacterium]